jgi:hypothetical protein
MLVLTVSSTLLALADEVIEWAASRPPYPVQQSMEHYHEKPFRILRNDKSCPGFALH